MPSLVERLQVALNEARKARDQHRTLLFSTILADLKNRENYIEIIVGNRPETHLTRTIPTPQRVWFKRPQPGLEAVEVESEGGRMNLVRFIYIPLERQLPYGD